MRIFVFAVLIIALIPGCLYIDMAESEFTDQVSLADLQGVYQNRGERKGKAVNTYLSQLVWPEDKVLVHKAVDRVEVAVPADRTLVLNAWAGMTLVKTGTYVEGVDFLLKDGYIDLGVETGTTIEPEAGVLAIHRETRRIGIDQQGHGRYASSGVEAGVALLFIPILAAGEDDVRFVRLE